MLRSLPVTDPAACTDRRGRQLLRSGRSSGAVGDVSVQSGGAVHGAGAGVRKRSRRSGRMGRVSVRRHGTKPRSRCGRNTSAAITFPTFGLARWAAGSSRLRTTRRRSFGGRAEPFIAWRPCMEPTPQWWGRPSPGGHAFSIIGALRPAGFFGETLRSDPPDLLFSAPRPLLDGKDNNLMKRSPFAAWLRMIGRRRPGASWRGLRLVEQGFCAWMQYDAGISGELDAEYRQRNSEGEYPRDTAGAGVEEMKESYERASVFCYR